MSVLAQSPGLLDALRGEMTPKFLATRSPEGIPNVVPVVSTLPDEEQPDTLFFGNFLLRKSIKNLERDTRVGLLVITADLNGWRLTGEFLGFERTGPHVERQMNSGLLRYNAYTGVRNAGLIRVTAVEGAFRVSKMQVLRDYVLARLATLGGIARAKDGVSIPLPVRREFGKMVAVKVLAWVRDDGYPTIVPMLSMQPAGAQTMVCWRGLRDLPAPPPGALVATNILTFEAISYQAKGRWMGSGNVGAVLVQEVYAGGPPHPGGRVA